jgi:hypothetical protein
MRELGLTARFMFSLPDDRVGYRDMGRRSTWDDHVEFRYADTLRCNYNLAKSGQDEVQTLTLSTEAAALFITFRQDMENRRKRGGELETLRSWSGKMESTVIRLAGILHLADARMDAKEIDVDVMRRAIIIGFYWISHAKIVENLWAADPTAIMADAMLDWIERKKLTEFSLRDAYRGNKAMFPTARDAVDPLEILTERGWIRTDSDLAASVGVRGVESPRMTVHPRLSSFRNNHGTHGTHGPKESFQELPTYLYSAHEHTPGDMSAMSAMNEMDTPEAGDDIDDASTTESDSQPTDPTDPYAIALAEGF